MKEILYNAATVLGMFVVTAMLYPDVVFQFVVTILGVFK